MYTEPNTEQKYLADHFLLLRSIIGLMGIVLPIILVAGTALFSGCTCIQPSISHYYYTNMGNVFVAYVICLSLFLLAYPGYEKDHIWSKLAFVFGCIFPFFPTDQRCCSECHCPFPWRPDIIATIHLTSASLFIIVLAIYSGCLFTKTDEEHNPGKQNKKKKTRNFIYRACAIAMLLSLAFLGGLFLLEHFKVQWAINLLNNTPVIFWGEVAALEAFGISWTVKGGVLWRDVNDPHPTTMKMANQFLFKRKIK